VRMRVHFAGEDRICGQEWNLRQVFRCSRSCRSGGNALFLFFAISSKDVNVLLKLNNIFPEDGGNNVLRNV
jgi:hypothetical protein